MNIIATAAHWVYDNLITYFIMLFVVGMVMTFAPADALTVLFTLMFVFLLQTVMFCAYTDYDRKR